MTHEDEPAGRSYDNRLMRRLLGYLSPYRGHVAFAIVVVLADSVVGLAGPYLTKEAIDNGIRHHDPVHLNLVAGLYLAVLVIGFGLGYLHSQVMQRVGQWVMLDLRLAMFRHLQRLRVGWFDRHPIGRVMTRLTNDVDTLNDLFAGGAITAVGDVFTLVGIVIAMVHLNAELLLVAFSVLPLIVVVTLVFRVLVRRSFRAIRARLARMNAFLNESLSGVGTLQLLNREERSNREFVELNAAHRDAHLEAVFYNALLFPVLELVGAIAVSLIVWYGGRQVMWTGITLGTLVAFLQYTQRFFRPMSDLGEKYGLLQQAMASAERVFELLDTPAGPAEPGEPAPMPDAARRAAEVGAMRAGDGRVSLADGGARARGRIEFDRVWFAYRDEHWVLEDVSFTVGPGERVALVGATGSGKTTLVHLLLRFYEPQRGDIRVDGTSIRDWDAGELRRRLGVVPQDVFLFSGTIAGNLSLGDPSLSRSALQRAAREVRAEEFILELPGGYEAPVVERGATLSGGQRQLLSFARALAREPEMLVLDEATSAVDTHTEGLVQQALGRLLEGRTCLVIAHRLSTVLDADRIVVLHHGRVRETGTHAELVARGGIYARLYELSCLGGRGLATAQGRLDLPPELLPTPSESQIVDAPMRLA